ncbi:hypothetical protein CBF45_13645 [Bordetella sp. J329]|nr:hypothetical protein CBF45_13645 [Bordetella sp. J329]
MAGDIAQRDQIVHGLYREHHAWLVSLLRRRLGDNHQAADLAQDVFERLLRVDLAHLLEPRAYLSTIATRLVASHFRRRALEQAWEEVMAGQPEPCCDSVETQYLILESLLAVWKALDGLSLRTRQIFLMAQIDGLSHQEIAAQLGVTANAVQKAVARGLEQCYLAVYDFS